MKRIYLCGPIADRSDRQCKDWREFVKANFKGECLDPLRRDYRGVQIDHDLAAQIVNDDLDDIDLCTGLLVYFDKPSVGTSMEVFYAATHEEFKKIVIVNHSGQPNISPWLLHHCDYVVDSLEEAMSLLSE